MMKRVAATLKEDSDLLRLEEEAEEQVSEVKAGDEKVKQTLDQLIDFLLLNMAGTPPREGAGKLPATTSGRRAWLQDAGQRRCSVPLPPHKGQAAEYPVLFSQPASSSIRLRPNQPREISIKSMPSNHWQALGQFIVKQRSDCHGGQRKEGKAGRPRQAHPSFHRAWRIR